MARFNQTYKFLPTPKKNMVTEDILKELRKNITRLDFDEEIKKQQLELSSIIIDKLTSEEWDEKDYFSFYHAINQCITENFTKHSLPAIIKVFSYSEEELKSALEQIKENTKDLEIPLYPYRTLITKEDKRQELQILDYDKMDAFKMVVVLLSKMSMNQTSEVKKLFVEKERTITIELLTEIIEGKRDDSAFLSNFDKEFEYLKDIEVYKELYFNYRQNYIKHLRRDFARRCQEELTHQQRAIDRLDIKKYSDIKYRRNTSSKSGYYKFFREK